MHACWNNTPYSFQSEKERLQPGWLTVKVLQWKVSMVMSSVLPEDCVYLLVSFSFAPSCWSSAVNRYRNCPSLKFWSSVTAWNVAQWARDKGPYLPVNPSSQLTVPKNPCGKELLPQREPIHPASDVLLWVPPINQLLWDHHTWKAPTYGTQSLLSAGGSGWGHMTGSTYYTYISNNICGTLMILAC